VADGKLRTAERARRPRWARFPLALAAGVAMAAAGVVFWFQPGVPGAEQVQPAPGGGSGGVVLQQDPVVELMERSRKLEAQLRRRGTPYGGHEPWNSSQQALVFRIADVDAQLGDVYAPGAGATGAAAAGTSRERLWRQRVALLESLLKVPAGQAVAHRAVF